MAISKFIVDITLRLDAKLGKFKQTPWIHSTGNPLPINHDWWNSTMWKQHKAPFMSASYNSQQEHVISNCVPVGNANFSNDLTNISNLCKFQHTTSTDNVHDTLLLITYHDINRHKHKDNNNNNTLLLPLSDDTNLTNIIKSNNSDVVDNSIDLIISVSTNNMLMTSCIDANDNMLMAINEIAVSRNTQSLTSCHETLISYSTYSNSVIANTTSANINTSSDNMLISVTPTNWADDVYRTSIKEEVFNLTHTPITFDKFHAFNEASSANLPSGFLHKFMECIQLRRDEFASVINLSDYPLTVPQLRVLSMGLKFTPLPHSVDRLSLRESIAKFERSLRLA